MSSVKLKGDQKYYEAGGKPFPKEEVEFILIGAGLPRTGTLSTFTALEMVLPGKCHHMARVATDKTTRNLDFWPKAVARVATDEDWRDFVRDERLSAAVDFPSSLFWKDLVKIYPNAKVLFNDRDPVRWYESVKNTIWHSFQLIHSPFVTFNPLFQLVMRLTGQKGKGVVQKAICQYVPSPLDTSFPGGMFGAIEEGQEEAVKFYQAWKAEVVKEVPADRLLIWEVKQGWEPLCQFLGIPVPESPFPNVNDTPMFQKRISGIRRMVTATWAATAGLVGIAAYYCFL